MLCTDWQRGSGLRESEGVVWSSAEDIGIGWFGFALASSIYLVLACAWPFP
jgi:hypothetical protein